MEKNRLKQSEQGRREPEHLLGVVKRRSLWLHKDVPGRYLGSGYRRVSVHLALLWTADRLDDELSLEGEAEAGAPSLPELPQAGPWQHFSGLLSHKLRERERGGLRGCLMATLLLSTVGRLTVPDPFRAADKALADCWKERKSHSSAEVSKLGERKLLASVVCLWFVLKWILKIAKLCRGPHADLVN